jgi:Glycosyl hydrolase family 65 central catalytic domain/Glycosyl hydrolase family 65, C-terminal domain
VTQTAAHATRPPAADPAFAAVSFDMDSVVTDTAGLQAAGWQALFDQVLPTLAAGRDLEPFLHAGPWLLAYDGYDPAAELVRRPANAVGRPGTNSWPSSRWTPIAPNTPTSAASISFWPLKAIAPTTTGCLNRPTCSCCSTCCPPRNSATSSIDSATHSPRHHPGHSRLLHRPHQPRFQLPRVVRAWVNARADRHQAWTLFTEALQADLADTQGGMIREGVHLGAMACTIDLVLRCFAGLESRDDLLWLHPVLPPELSRAEFSIPYRGQQIKVELTLGWPGCDCGCATRRRSTDASKDNGPQCILATYSKRRELTGQPGIC